MTHVQLVARVAGRSTVQIHIRGILLAFPRRRPEGAILVYVLTLISYILRLGPVLPYTSHVLDGRCETRFGRFAFVRCHRQTLCDAELYRTPKARHARKATTL